MDRVLVAVIAAAGVAGMACDSSSTSATWRPGATPDATAPSESDGSTGDSGSAEDAGAPAPRDATTGHAGPDGASTGASSQDAAASGGSMDASTVVRPDAQSTDAGAGSGACGASAVFGGGPLTTTATHLDIGVHDPSMIWDGSQYYLFATGGTLSVRSSPDILTYSAAGNVFSSIPAWIPATLGANPGSLWAPDISYFGGQFHVYYAGSTFGSNDSVIGVATTASLRTPQWVDQGVVVQSVTSDDFNAIDPNVSFDESCVPWLAFGSFWSGIKLRQLDPSTGKPSTTNTTTYSLASRNGGAIEAASIISHNGFYYLFVSFDLCCKGVSSTYRTMVGRANAITGPYSDKAGNGMLDGAAEQLLASSGRYIGPGGGTAWRDGNAYLYAYHYYDGDANGASKLQIRPITFDAEDWVVLGDPLFP